MTSRWRLAAASLAVAALVAVQAGVGLAAGRWWVDRLEDVSSSGGPGVLAGLPPHEADRAPSAAELLRREAQALLGRRAAAVLAGDLPAYLAVFDAQPPLQAEQAARFASLSALGMGAFTYEVRSARLEGGIVEAGQTAASVQATLRYRVAGVDRSDVVVPAEVGMVRGPVGWRLTGDRPSAESGAAAQLWDYGPLEVARGARSVVVGLAGAGPVQSVVPQAEAAWARVEAVWGPADAEGALVVVPGTSEQLGALLGQDPQAWAEVAALTAGGSDGVARLYLNPATLDRLGAKGRGIVLAHELTHLVSRAPSSRTAPLWLREGFADYVGFSGSGVPLRTAASEGLDEVRRAGAPAGWTPDSRFATGGPDAPAAYALGHVACQAIAQRYGEPALVAFYRAVQSGAGSPEANVAAAALSVLGADEATVLAQWRADLLALAG